jgi:hypothetical protein
MSVELAAYRVLSVSAYLSCGHSEVTRRRFNAKNAATQAAKTAVTRRRIGRLRTSI